MTALDTDDLAVITGPLTYCFGKHTLDGALLPGEVVRVLEIEDEQGDADVYGCESGEYAYISASSLTPLSEIQEDPEVLWGETPYVVFSDIHDYVYEGDE